MNHFLSAVVLVLSLCCLSCTNNDEMVSIPPNISQYLDLQFVTGSVTANLMPFIPPDPISAAITLTAKNTHASQSMIGLRILKADVFRQTDSTLLGTFNFTSTWDGDLNPGDQDVVVAAKVRASATLFNPPCNEYVYLTILVGTDSNNVKVITSDSLRFACVY